MRRSSSILADQVFDGTRFRHEALLIEVAGAVIQGVRPCDPDHPPGGCDLDARGDWVLPGLINAHTHLARGGMFRPNELVSIDQVARNLRDLLAAGVTAVGEMGSAAGLVHALRAHLASHPACGPSISACGPLLTVRGGYPLDWMSPTFARLGVVRLCETEEEARRSVRWVRERGMDHVKLVTMHRSYAEKPIPTMSPAAARAVVDEAHRLGLKVLAHAHYLDDYRLALDAGVDALMHSCFEPLDDEMVERVRSSGAYVNPTLWVFEGALRGIEERLDRDPAYFRHVSRAVRRDWSGFCEAFAASGDVVPAGMAGGLPKQRGREAAANAAANFARLRQAGVPMAFGTDASYGFSLLGRPVDELAAMQRAGMPPAECLRAATANAADLLSLPDRGVLAPGKRADLVVVRGNLEKDVAAVENVRAVMAAGRLPDDSPLRQAGRSFLTAAAVTHGLLRTAAWSITKQ